MSRSIFIFGFIIIVLLSSCEMIMKPKRIISEDDVLLASVEGRELYLSEIGSMISSTSESDSIAQLNLFIDSWLKRTVVLTEAEDNFPKNVDIDKLVEDYRSSLLLHNYRQALVKKALDTVVTSAQENEYYELNKEQYPLQDKIIKGRIAAVPDNSRKIEGFYRNWKKNDSLKIETYLSTNATININQDKWYNIDEFISLLPAGKFKLREFNKKGDLQKHITDSEYFIKILDVKEKNEVAPLAYIKENIRKVIIHKRKNKILENIEQSLYETYLNANRITVFK